MQLHTGFQFKFYVKEKKPWVEAGNFCGLDSSSGQQLS
jgi:hypothetical protein